MTEHYQRLCALQADYPDQVELLKLVIETRDKNNPYSIWFYTPSYPSDLKFVSAPTFDAAMAKARDWLKERRALNRAYAADFGEAA
jgi:hypothetical protein